VLANAGNLQGAQVTTLFGTPEIRPKRKYSLLPLLVVVFLLSYGLMTLLIVAQSNTIESQRSTIQQLVQSGNEMSALKNKQVQQQAQAAEVPSATTQAQADVANVSPVPAPSTQAAPSEKANKAHSGAKVRRPLPEKPPMPTSEIADERRSLMSI
jgi:type IV secretory pathway VirJ component